MENHYVYGLEDQITGEFYIGVRSCNCDPEIDEYMGSPVSWTPKNKLTKHIIFDHFKTREEANIAERDLISYYIDSKINKNYYIPDIGFCTKGMKKGPLSEQHKESISKALKGRKRSKREVSKSKESLKEYWKSERSNKHREKINEAIRGMEGSGHRAVKVKRLSTGEVYNSINECADAHNVSYATIGRWCDKQDSDFKRLQPKIEYNREKYIHPDANITLEEAKDVLRLIKKEEDLSPKEIQRRTDADYQTIKDMKYKGRYSWVLDE